MKAALIELVRTHAGAIFRAGLGPFLLGAILVGLATAALIIGARRWGLFRGGWGLAAGIFVGSAGFLAAVLVGSAAAGPAWAAAAVSQVGQDRNQLGLAEPVGRALLVPAADAFTSGGTDDAALHALERRGSGIDLLALTQEPGRSRTLAALTPAFLLSAYEPRVTALLAHTLSQQPAWLGVETTTTVRREIEHLANAYPELLAALRPENGRLSVFLASHQIAERFLVDYAPPRARETVAAYRPRAITWIAGVFLGLWAIAAAIGWATRERPRG